VHLCPPTLKMVPPPMRRLPVKQMFRTWLLVKKMFSHLKTLLYCGYKYLLNLLVTLVMTYISYLLFLVKSLSSELQDCI